MENSRPEKHLAVTYKTNHVINSEPSNCAGEQLFQKDENLCPHENLYTNIHNSFICNNLKLGMTQMSIKVNKPWPICTALDNSQ